MIVENITADEFEFLDDKLIEYNGTKCGITATEFFDGIYKCIKSNGKIIGGISGDVELKCALHIKLFYLNENFRGNHLGNKLLNAIEKEAIAKGAVFAYLETFDFQAKDFYVKNGYEVFSQLNYPTGNIMYFMKRNFV